jgi:anthraniloyl-CoA monooxygenase
VTGALDIVCIGGGAAGLYFSVLAKQANPNHRITVYERNRADDTFGFGVVFSDNTMGFLTEQDRQSYPEITRQSMHWDPITVIHGGRTMRCRGVGFSAIERKTLLAILQAQAAELGVELHFQSEVSQPEHFTSKADLVVGCDGVNSTVRLSIEDKLGTSIEVGPTRFTWLGTTKGFDSLTFFFEENEHGAFGAHIYPYRPDRATFIVETDEATYQRAGMERFSEADTIDYCERLFARHLEGHRLLSNRSLWFQFRTLRNRRWSDGNVVLIGDAAHTAHFSVGSGTKMAMEDALALSQALQRSSGVPAALAAFEEERHPRVEHIQRAAASSFDWWSSFRHYIQMPPLQFSFNYISRSQFRYDTLHPRDPEYLADVEAASGLGDLCKRVIAQQPPGDDGTALAGLISEAPVIMTQLVAVSESGRVTSQDPGLWTAEQAEGWRRQASALREAGGQLCLQLSHAGPRAAMRPRREGLDRPLADSSWPATAASSVPYVPGGPVPLELDAARMEEVEADFVRAARLARDAGVEWLQLQFGHGYLLGSFISPLTNRREDGFGGALDDRLKFPLQVLDAVRAEWPTERRLLVAFSATDWVPSGLPPAEALRAAACFRDHGCDYLTVLSGQTTWRSRPPYGRCFNAVLQGKIRLEAGVPTIAAGGITDLDDVRTLLLAGRADLCLLDHARLSPLRCA